MNFSDQVQLIKRSKQLHNAWYRETYPEVADLAMDSAEHYLRYGAAMGRNPGKNFDTRFYANSHPDVAESGLNPLVHFALHGSGKGYLCRQSANRGSEQVDVIRTKLLSLGFTERPLRELNDLLATSPDPETRAHAARELALWHMREKSGQGYRTALDYIAKARADAPDLDFRSKLTTAELLCHYHLGAATAGQECYERAALAGEVTPDVTLAWVNFQPTPETRVAWINTMLERHGVEPVTLLPDDGRPPYDRLTCAVDLPKVTDGPRVTVLIAAYDAAEMLPTALRSLQEQTWQNLEIIVLDDCSPTLETVEVARRFAAVDPRIRVIRMPENGGAYVARNRGLDEATGEFVTLHDADDWSHPRKIETQVRFLMDNPDVVGCMSEQARQRSDLSFQRWTGQGSIIITNVSSFLWRLAPVRAELGYWDTVRFSADSEFIRRARRVFGPKSVVEIRTGPLSFQRDSGSSVIADDVMGMNGFYFGARKEYLDAQRHYHTCGRSLKYTNKLNLRPFPVPALMNPVRKGLHESRQHFDMVIAGDFREDSPFLIDYVNQVRHLKSQGKRIGLIQICSYDLQGENMRFVSERLREHIDGNEVVMLVFGDDVTCSSISGAKIIASDCDQRYLPRVSVIPELFAAPC
jgi:glycosyltransferase involved in cell wall biosynthesis